MAGFTSRDGIINAITTLERQEARNFFKNVTANTQGAVAWQSLLAIPGAPGAATTLVSSGVHDSDAVSSFPGSMFFGDQTPFSRYLLSFGAVATTPCTLMLYDRLATISSVSITTTGAKTVGTGTLTRYTGTQSTLNEAWLEVTTATTTTAAVGTMAYVDGGGNSVTGTASSWAMPAAATPANTMVQIPVSSTAVPGIRSVTSITPSVAASAGAVNVVILRPIARIPLGANLWNEVSFLDDPMGLPRIYDNATLCLAVLGPTAAHTIWGNFSTVYS